jgi:hypothetical protein
VHIDDKPLSFNEIWNSPGNDFMTIEYFSSENTLADDDSRVSDVDPRLPPITTMEWSATI